MQLAVVALLAAALALGLSGVAHAKDKRKLDVMTQNLYLGSSLTPALEATTQAEFIAAVAAMVGTVQFTDFPARSQAIAAEIEDEQPDVIGIQEATKWTTTGPGAPPSLDFLAILQQDLANRGLDYSVAAVSDNADIGPVPLAGLCSGPFGSCTVKLQDRDVILVNNDTPRLAVSNPQSGDYVAQEVVTTPVGQVSFARGWASVDGTLEGKRFHFVNTHLEIEDFPAVQEAQAREFLQGPAKAGGAVIATGDFNSAADGSETASYGELTHSYFNDAWDANAGDPGFTCCQNSTLTNPTSALHKRIDLVLAHAAAGALSARVVGDTPFQGSPPFWPSDHAGVIATVRIH